MWILDRITLALCSADAVTQKPQRILFTAFEPSGDDLGSAVIAALRARRPDIEIFAWGGAKMEAAGATVIERTGEDAVVGMPGPAKIMEHVRLNQRIAQWMEQHELALHVPVDSPAANFPICKEAKKRGVRVAHLAAPQLWAWAPWRIRKLRRLTDHVMCLLPFEEEWFRSRGVPATFIGHPLFDSDENQWRGEPDSAPDESRPLRLGVMPGSRPKELTRHLPLMLQVLSSLRAQWPDLDIRFAVQDDGAAERVRALATRHGGLPTDAAIERGAHSVAQVASWADVCLTKSGTVTLHITRQRRPMVVVYRTVTLTYLLVGQWLLTTPHRAMPNLIAGRRIVDEFVPHVGGAAPITSAVRALLSDHAKRETVRRELDAVAAKFEGKSAAAAASDVIERLLQES